MAARIIYSSRFISGYVKGVVETSFATSPPPPPPSISDCFVSRTVGLTFLCSFVVTMTSYYFVLGPYLNLVFVPFKFVVVHIGIGAICFCATVFVLWRKERAFLASFREIMWSNKEKRDQ
jgi:hypothetical protein